MCFTQNQIETKTPSKKPSLLRACSVQFHWPSGVLVTTHFSLNIHQFHANIYISDAMLKKALINEF